MILDIKVKKVVEKISSQSATQKNNRPERLDLRKSSRIGIFAKITNFTLCYAYML
jgi:hypothetical protein